ncbi:MAG: MG2 domain-containing protein, partial [Spirochaetota bacterium]
NVSTELASYAIKYYEALSEDVSAVTIKETDDPFTIVDFGPVEELPAEIRRPSIYVVFSQPVVPLSELGRLKNTSEIMSINPPLKGVFRWYGTKLLSFDADDDVLPQQRYTVTVNKNTRSLGGKPLTGEIGFSFHTEYLQVREFFPGSKDTFVDLEDVPLEAAKTITLVFSYPVNPDVIGDYIRVESLGRSYSFTIARPENRNKTLEEEEIKRTVILSMAESFKGNSQVKVTIRKGARSEKEFIGIPEDIVRTFTTIKPFRYVDYQTDSWYFPQSAEGEVHPVYLRFSHPVDKEGLQGKIHTEPFMEIRDENLDVWETTIRLKNLPVDYESIYTVFLSAWIKDIYGRPMGKSVSVKVKVPPASSYAYFPNTGSRMLEAQFPPRIIYEYRNIFDGVWKAGKIEDPYAAFKEEDLAPYDFSALKKNLRHFEVLDLRPWLNADGKGFVGFSWNFAPKDETGKRPAWGKEDLQLQVTDLAVTTRYASNKVIALVTSLSTGNPVEGAVVSLKRERDVKLAQVTDKNGLAFFRFEKAEYFKNFGDSENDGHDHLRFSVEKDADRLEFKPNQSHNIWHFGIYNTEAPVNAHTSRMATYLFTDRGLYKSGETVTFKGIDKNLQFGQYAPYRGNYSIQVKESRYRGKTLHTLEGSTTSTGGFYVSFSLPEYLEPGYYDIVYSRPGGTSSISFQIASFRRLLFSVDIKKPDVPSFAGDTLNFHVSAVYLSGGKLSGGSYEYYWAKAPAFFSPPGKRWESYRFGPNTSDGRSTLSQSNGKLSPSGDIDAIQKTTSEGVEGLPYTYSLEA